MKEEKTTYAKLMKNTNKEDKNVQGGEEGDEVGVDYDSKRGSFQIPIQGAREQRRR